MGQFEDVESASESAILVGLPPSNRAVVGRLCFDPDDGISLQLLDQVSLAETLTRAQVHFPSVLGQLVNGPRVTLVDATVANTNFGAGGFADVRIIANQLLVGIHLSDPAVRSFDEVRVALTGLNEWFGVSPVTWSLEELPPPETGRKATVTCRHLPRFAFSPVSGGPSLESEQVISPSIHLPHRGSIANQFELCLRPRAPFGLEQCVFELFRLQALMSILCGHQVYYKHARLFLHGVEGADRQRNVVTYMQRFARPTKEAKKFRVDEVLLPLPLIRESLPSLWCTWTERYEQYRSAVELFTSTEMFGGQLLNFQLLAIMQALETFHRNRFGGTYAEEEDYQRIAGVLAAAIPATTAADLRSALKAKLKYGNEYSLRKRLRLLADGLPGRASGGVGALIHPSLGEFLSRSVDTRNYLTHYTAELETVAFRDADLYWATRLLRWFFVAVLLNDMGLPEDQLVDALTRAGDLSHARESLTRPGPPSSIVEEVGPPAREPPSAAAPAAESPAAPVHATASPSSATEAVAAEATGDRPAQGAAPPPGTTGEH